MFAAVLLVAGCGGNATQNPPSPPKTHASPTASVPTPISAAPATPAALHGIVVVVSDDSGTCKLRVIDPATGAVTPLHKFKKQTISMNNDCDSNESTAPIIFSSNFDRLTYDPSAQHDRAGWIDADGHFQPVGIAGSTPTFGDQTQVGSIGFDKLDNFYYSVMKQGVGNVWDGDIYRVPTNTVGDGELIGTGGGGQKFGRLRDGTLGFGALHDITDTCNADSDFDPNKTVYYTSVDDVIFGNAAYCDSTGGRPLIPKSNIGVGDIVASPDGSKIAFSAGEGKLFTVPADGGQPNEIPLKPTMPASLLEWHFRGWL